MRRIVTTYAQEIVLKLNPASSMTYLQSYGTFLPFAGPDLAEHLRLFVRGEMGDGGVLPWTERLSVQQRHRLRRDLALLLAEPEVTGEPLDWREIEDVLREYAEVAGWAGPVADVPPAIEPDACYAVEVRSEEVRALERASPAVRQAARDLLFRFLPLHPTDGERLGRGRLKKMGNRGIWQIDLPDGYRLRYFVAEPERTVFVVYLGPHPDGEADGREQAVQAMIQRRRHGGG
jgi:mRNA-degrading endonuclease RelE of RelBE toxin-antitoxin system